MGEYGNRGFSRGGSSRGGSSFGRRQGGFGGGGSRSGGSSFGQERSFAPVKVGEELDVTIEAVAAKGDGVAKKDGFVIFVPGTKVGDKVRIRITKVSRRLGFGEVIGQSDGSSAPEQTSEAQPEQEETFEDSENFGEEESSEASTEESQESAEEPSEDEEQQY